MNRTKWGFYAAAIQILGMSLCGMGGVLPTAAGVTLCMYAGHVIARKVIL